MRAFRVAKVGQPLTTAEQKVCDGLVRGDSYVEIASSLNIAKGTVRFHVTTILKKKGVPSRPKLMAQYFIGKMVGQQLPQGLE